MFRDIFGTLYQIVLKETIMKGPNYHHIVKISGICLQFKNMNLCALNQYPNTNKIFAKILLGS